jgi:uncharacterized protein (TIGR02246 family)
MNRYVIRTISTVQGAPRWCAVVLGAVAVLLAVLVPAAGRASAELPAGVGHDRDLAALQELRERQEEAWARGDARAYAAVYTPDADVITFNGDHLSTRAGIEEGMAYYFATYLSGTRLLQQDERVRFVEPDLVVIVRSGCVLWPGESACTEEALSVNTNVAVKRHGRWLYTSFQNTRVRPLEPAESRATR